MTSVSQDNAYNAAAFIRLSKAGKKRNKKQYTIFLQVYFLGHKVSKNKEVFFLV